MVPRKFLVVQPSSSSLAASSRDRKSVPTISRSTDGKAEICANSSSSSRERSAYWQQSGSELIAAR